MALERNAEKIKSILKVINEQVITTKGCRIIFPERYEMTGLASIGSVSSLYGLFQITTLDSQYYAIHNCLNTITTIPDDINKIKIDDEPHYEFVYDPGSVVINSVYLVKDKFLIGKVYKRFVNRGYIPKFINYNDLNNIFINAKKHTGSSIGDFDALAVPMSIISRVPSDPNKYYREILNDVNPDVIKPLFVPASSVNFSASTALTKLTGSYFYDGVVSAVNNPTEKTELIDHVLRY